MTEETKKPPTLYDIKEALENEVLEKILREAPIEVSYEPHNNGFYLKNNDLRLQYTKISAFSRNHIDLWFLGINPKIKVSASSVNMNNLKTINCSYICTHTGNTHGFSFPLDGSISDTLGISSLEEEGKEKWYDKGTELLKEAISKYQVDEWFKYSNGKINARPNLSKPRTQSLLQKISRIFN